MINEETTITTEDAVETIVEPQEYVLIGDKSYPARVNTGVQSISITVDLYLNEAVDTFKPVTDLMVSGEDKKPYGIYSNLKFASATYQNDEVTIKYVIPTDMERRLSVVEETVDTCAGAIEELAEIIGGAE